ncbi:MAG: Ni,Fe-hydrogenase III large subunit, partial [Burkholderiales bacterium]
QGMRLAARVSGDSTVAYSWAYAMAVETLTASTPPARALWLRALYLERERLANHLGDLGYLGNDGGLAFGLAQFMRLKEDVLRLNARLAGHRYLMDLVIPGGVMRDIERSALEEFATQCDVLETEVRKLKGIYDDHAGLQDRFMTCGILSAATAHTLGVVGLAARASGQAMDVRSAPGLAPYDVLDVKPVTARSGDVAARVAVRFGEIFESLRLIRTIVERIAPGAICIELPVPQAGSIGLGWVEGWRGEVLLAIHVDAGARIRRAHAHDPSWQNWPALEYAVIGNIVPDFPLINKSFNLSYAGVDL